MALLSQVKIIATIGPSTATPAALKALVEAGANVARLNGSHGDLEWHAAAIKLLREVVPHMPILLDIPGRKIRTAALEYEPTFAVGDCVVLTTSPNHNGHFKVPVSYPNLHEDLSAGDIILADDGQLRFWVQAVTGHDIVCRAEAAGTLRSRKGINCPGVTLRTALVTEGDQHMLAFAKEQAVDFVGISFVESASHVELIRSAIGQASPRIIAKIETQSALENLTEIVAAADAIMIDRGDLAVETSLHGIALMQKRILSAAHQGSKPAIVATEMLHSMIGSPVPTKAEITDITNAVLDGAAAVMLSGETAIGKFPAESVATMRQIADQTSAHLQAQLDHDDCGETFSVPEAIGDAIALVCRRLPVTKIVAVTISGYAARTLAARMPRQPILAVSNDPAAARSFELLPGTRGIHVDIPFVRTSTDHIPKCLEALWRRGQLVDDDLVLVTSVGYPRSGNRMNLIQTHNVADLRESLGWASTPEIPNDPPIEAAISETKQDGPYVAELRRFGGASRTV
jgi:pyruvate kinase